jgi:hypothetical protein
MIVTMVIPTLDSQKLKKAGHRFSFWGLICVRQLRTDQAPAWIRLDIVA